MEAMIEIRSLTRDYGGGRGLFDLSLEVAPGEAVGLMGVNGAGKTTLVRHVMGFLAPRRGSVRVRGLDAWHDAPRVKRKTGYVPGEIAFPDVGSGDAFLALHARYLGGADLQEARELARLFDLDTAARLRSMSKGMKQKTALVAAFMGEPDLLVLDEPTTGLDPVMQRAFIDVVRRARARGATVLMSSHLSDELEAVCDRVALIRDGRIVDTVRIDAIRGNERVKEFELAFADADELRAFVGETCAGEGLAGEKFALVRRDDARLCATVRVPDARIGALIGALAARRLRWMSQKPCTLETYFKDAYRAGARGTDCHGSSRCAAVVGGPKRGAHRD